MAANYTIGPAKQTQQVLSQTQANDVELVGIYTKPSGIFMNVVVPLRAWQSGDYGTYLQRPAQWVEQLIAGGYVTNGQWYQDTDQNDLLAGYVRLTVTYLSSAGFTLSEYVSVPMSILALADPFDTPYNGNTLSNFIFLAHNRLVNAAGGPASDLVQLDTG